MSRKHLEIIWKIELWFGTHSFTPRTIYPQWWTDSWVSLNFSFELNGSKQVLNKHHTDCLLLTNATHWHSSSETHSCPDIMQATEKFWCSCFSTQRKMDKFFQKSCSYSGDCSTRMRIRSKKNLIKTQAVQVLQTLFLRPTSNLFILLLENQFH